MKYEQKCFSHMSAKSPSNVSLNPSEVISLKNPKTNFENPPFQSKHSVEKHNLNIFAIYSACKVSEHKDNILHFFPPKGAQCGLRSEVWCGLKFLCDIGAHAKCQNPNRREQVQVQEEGLPTEFRKRPEFSLLLNIVI